MKRSDFHYGGQYHWILVPLLGAPMIFGFALFLNWLMAVNGQ